MDDENSTNRLWKNFTRARGIGNKSLLALLVAFMLSGCATASFTKGAYNTLATSAEAYDATMSALGEMYAKGRINEAQKVKTVLYGEDFWLAYHAAVDALESYYISKDQASVYMRLATLSKALGSFLEYAQTLPGD